MLKPVLLFDLDGTLIDSEPGILQCLKETIQQYKLTIPSEATLREFIGPPIGQALFKILRLKTDAEIPEAVATYRKFYSDHGVLNCRLYPGIIELLNQLSKLGYTKFIVTSKAQVYAEQIARHHQIDQFFQGIYGPDFKGTQHQKSESIAQLLQEHVLLAEQCVMIGDRENDITAANIHQMQTLGVLWGYGSVEELTTAGAEKFVNKPAEILEIITSL